MDAQTHFEKIPLEIIRQQIANGEILEMPASDDASEIESETEPVHMEGLTYPQWQKFFQEALLELDSGRLRERVTVAETTIANRLQSISQETDGHAERLALADALSTLRILSQEACKSSD